MDWTSLTDFGDSAAMLPAAALLLAWLIADGQGRSAALWATLFVLQSGVVAASKIAFRGWGIGIESLDFTGFSGHSTLACSVIPIILGVVSRPAGRLFQAGAVTLGAMLGAAIGLSRIALAMHSWSEVVGGCALGGLVAAAFLLLSGRARDTPRLPIPAVASVFVVLMLLMHGTRAPSERLITSMALHLSGHSVPYTRYDLHEPWRRQMWGGPARSLGGGLGHRLVSVDPAHPQPADFAGVHIHDPEFQA